MASQDQNREVASPLLFISHRHSDRNLANAITDWAGKWALGNITVFQSSSIGSAPRIGINLNSQLMEKLRDAQSVVLIYTSSDQNWSYCMWECGVALDPKKPDTKIIVFQCGESVPAPFQDRVRVNARDKASVRNFAVDFLTKTDFFPRYGKALAPKLTAKSTQVRQAGKELYDTLLKILPPLEPEPAQEWSAVGYMQLELDYEAVEKINNAPAEDRQDVAHRVVLDSCVVRDSDSDAARVIGMADLKGLAFNSVVEAWQETVDSKDTDGVLEIVRQISLAARWRLPGVDWTLMLGANKNWYAPMIHWVRRIPSQRVMQFDLHFLPIPPTGIPPIRDGGPIKEDRRTK